MGAPPLGCSSGRREKTSRSWRAIRRRGLEPLTPEGDLYQDENRTAPARDVSFNCQRARELSRRREPSRKRKRATLSDRPRLAWLLAKRLEQRPPDEGGGHGRARPSRRPLTGVQIEEDVEGRQHGASD